MTDQRDPNRPGSPPGAPTVATTVRVAGMTCDHCVRAVTDELSQVDGVQDVAVDLAAGAVTIRGDGALDLEAVAAAVAEAGYELVP
jgi:copper chaperone CopZ